ncbi:MAG: YapH protein [Chitinophagaceae bacterium]|nr:YapH protein [Chitinophagaceae bacterium]
MRKLTFAALGLLAFASNSNAQSTATATATASVIAPISISKNADMSFGNIAVQSGSGGTVILAPAGTRTSTSGVTLPSTTGTVTAAAFTVTGSGSLTYAITLPSSVTLTHSLGVQTMAASSFTSNPSATGALSSGTQDIAVGATLTVAAGQLAGVYTSGNFNVTVNYN